MNQKYVSKWIFSCLQETRMRRSKREENRCMIRYKEDKTAKEKKSPALIKFVIK